MSAQPTMPERSGRLLGKRSALCLDAGGVLICPSARHVSSELSKYGCKVIGDTPRPHYVGVAAFDRSGALEDYRRAFAACLGVPAKGIDRAIEDPVWNARWTASLPGAQRALRMLSSKFCRIAIVSDSDGTVESQLLNARVCQVGAGDLPRVDAVIDSAIVGATKPDPRIFAAALGSLDASADLTIHVGDSWRCDVQGAEAAGLRPVHVDPLGLCRQDGHLHVRGLLEYAERVCLDGG